MQRERSEAVRRWSGTATDCGGPRKSGLPDLRAYGRRSRVNPRSVSAAHHSAALHAALRPGHENAASRHSCATAWPARSTNLRLWEKIAGPDRLFPGCYLQRMVQPKRV